MALLHRSRADGRDAFSKIAAFRAGEPSPSVPNPSGLSAISRFLVSNGYVPDSGSFRSSAAQDDDEDSKSDRVSSPPTPDLIMDDGTSEFSFNSAPTARPVTHLDEREGSAPYVFPQEGANRERSAPAYPGHRSLDKDSEATAGSQQRRTSVVGIDHGDEIAALRLEVAQLHKTFLEATGSQGLRKDGGVKEEPQDDVPPLDMMTDEGIRVASLEERLAQVEERMDKMHHTMLPNLMARVGRLEQVTEDLAAQAGEAAKVKEVFRGLKEAFVAVGDI